MKIYLFLQNPGMKGDNFNNFYVSSSTNENMIMYVQHKEGCDTELRNKSSNTFKSLEGPKFVRLKLGMFFVTTCFFRGIEEYMYYDFFLNEIQKTFTLQFYINTVSSY